MPVRGLLENQIGSVPEMETDSNLSKYAGSEGSRIGSKGRT